MTRDQHEWENNEIKQYLVFAYDEYRPCGGWDDYKDAFTTVESAKIFADSLDYEYVHIVDLKTLTVIYRR